MSLAIKLGLKHRIYVSAPYVQLDMNPTLPGVEESAVQKDVMFFSGHKFIGGIQAPGILIAKKFLFKNSLPKVNSSLSEEKEEGETVNNKNCN